MMPMISALNSGVIRRLAVPLALASALLAGCGSAGYYAQSVRGHLALMAAARPIDELLADPVTPADLKARRAIGRLSSCADGDRDTDVRHGVMSFPVVVVPTVAQPSAPDLRTVHGGSRRRASGR